MVFFFGKKWWRVCDRTELCDKCKKVPNQSPRKVTKTQRARCVLTVKLLFVKNFHLYLFVTLGNMFLEGKITLFNKQFFVLINRKVKKAIASIF